jgi:hypothetical protein
MDLSFKGLGKVSRSGIGFLVVGMMMVSCESMVSVVPQSSIGKAEKKLVVVSFLSPQDTLIRVMVTQSTPMYDDLDRNTEFVVSDGEVVLSGGGVSVPLRFDSSEQLYTVKPEAIGGVVAGVTYDLQVKRGDQKATASLTIPSAGAAIDSYRVDTSYHSSWGRDTTLAVQFQWQDRIGSNNFYRVSGQALIESEFREYKEGGEYVNSRGQFWVPLDWDRTYGIEEIRSDVGQDGSLMESPVGRVSLRTPSYVESDGGLSYADNPVLVQEITLSLLHVDAHYYHYHRSLELHDRATNNPFAEPVLIYTNVRGGLGIFAGYNSFSIRIKP